MAELPTEDKHYFFDSRELAASLTQDLVASAARQICFFGPSVDPVLFDNDRVVSLISEFARRSPRTEVRFVVGDTKKNISQSHRLLPLAEKLCSKIKIHIASRKHQEIQKMFLLVDTKAFLLCPNHTRYEGRVEFDAAASVRDMQQDFEEIWTHSTPDINIRRLHL